MVSKITGKIPWEKFEFFTSLMKKKKKEKKKKKQLLGVQPWSLFMQRMNVAIRKMHFCQIHRSFYTEGFNFKSNPNYVVLKIVYA